MYVVQYSKMNAVWQINRLFLFRDLNMCPLRRNYAQAVRDFHLPHEKSSWKFRIVTSNPLTDQNNHTNPHPATTTCATITSHTQPHPFAQLHHFRTKPHPLVRSHNIPNLATPTGAALATHTQPQQLTPTCTAAPSQNPDAPTCAQS